jgi:hypothetical protein
MSENQNQSSPTHLEMPEASTEEHIEWIRRQIALIEEQAEEDRQTWKSLIEREKQFLAKMAERQKAWEKERAPFAPHRARKIARRTAQRRKRR